MELQITIEQVKALLVIAPKSDARYYLNGALLEVKNGQAWLVATDGMRLLAINLTDGLRDLCDGQYIIPRDLLAGAKAKKSASVTVALDHFSSDSVARVRIITGASELAAPTIDGRFPDWRRVVPTHVSGAPAHYDPAYVGDFGTVAELLGGARISARIYPNGTDAAPVELGTDQALGLLMPLRAECFQYVRPEWSR